MRVWMLQLGMSLILAIGPWTGMLPAQPPTAPGVRPETVPYPQQVPFTQQVHLPPASGLLVVPAVPYEPAYHPPYEMAIAPTPQPPRSPYHAQRALNNHGVACEANRWGACSSLNYELRFFFGSCRDFFGESCTPGQPCFSRQGPR